MRYIDKYKLFESKKETESTLKDILSKLPNEFYYRLRLGRSKSSNDRNLSNALGEYSNIEIIITRILSVEQANIWAHGKKEIKTKQFEYFTIRDISNVLDELKERLPEYKMGNCIAGTGSFSYISPFESMGSREMLSLTIEMSFKTIPRWKSSKTQRDNDITDIFSDVFDVWIPDINVKEAGDFYKIMSMASNMSPYNIPPMTDTIKVDLIDAINRFEVAMECDLINANFRFRDYNKVHEYSNSNFSIGNRVFGTTDYIKNKEMAFEFIRNNDIIELTLYFRKKNI